jgi:hypothetical protein
MFKKLSKKLSRTKATPKDIHPVMTLASALTTTQRYSCISKIEQNTIPSLPTDFLFVNDAEFQKRRIFKR